MQYRYSFEDLSCANDILSDLDLYPSHFHVWASKVAAYFRAFYTLLRKYRKTLSSRMAMAALCQTLRERAQTSIYTILNSFEQDAERAKRRANETAKKEAQQKAAANATRFGNFSSYDDYNDQTIKVRSGKWKRRTRVMKQTGFWYAFSE